MGGCRLNGEAADAAAAAAAAWTNAGAYALLPWSCVVLECVPAEEVGDVRGVDRWNEVESLAKEISASESSSSDSGWSSDDGGPPVEPVDPSELPDKASLTFGQGLVEQGFGDSNEMPTAMKTPASAPAGPAGTRPREMRKSHEALVVRSPGPSAAQHVGTHRLFVSAPFKLRSVSFPVASASASAADMLSPWEI